MVNASVLKRVTKSQLSQQFTHLLKGMQSDQTVLWIDDLPKKHLKEIVSMFYSNLVIIEPQGKRSFPIELTEVIICCECELFDIPTDASFFARYRIYNCGQANSAGVAMMIINPEMFSPQTNISI